MDRGWYIRFAVVVVAVTLGWLAFWPSIDSWVPCPTWVKDTFASRIAPGLDIQGGLRLTYEVDIEAAIRKKRDVIADQMLGLIGVKLGVIEEDQAAQLNDAQREQIQARVTVRTAGEQSIRATFSNAEDAEKLDRAWLREKFPEIRLVERQPGEDGAVVATYRLTDATVETLSQESVERAVETIENRVNELGVREMTIEGRPDEGDIIVEIPGGDPISRIISTMLTQITGQEPGDDDTYRVEISREELGRLSGLEEEETDEALRKILNERYTRRVMNATPTENDEIQTEEVPVVREEDGAFVILNLDELKALSAFENVRDIISRTAQLEFKAVEESSTFVSELQNLPEGITIAREGAEDGPSRPVTAFYLRAEGEGAQQRLRDYVSTLVVPEGRELLLGEEEQDPSAQEQVEAWRTYMLLTAAPVTGDDIRDAYVGTDPNTQNPVVLLSFSPQGADEWADFTGAHERRRVAIVLDETVKSAPRINERIGGGNTQISLGSSFAGDQSVQREASDLVIVLKAGALPAPLSPTNEQLIGPTLGRDSIERGIQGALVGIILVLVFMAFYYQVGGLVADVMVTLNVLFLLALLAVLEATLTLPGLAGIALTVGMAVDANVLITERIREELRLGKSPRSAVDQGFKRAFSSILDGQLTTFIAGVVLFQFGTGAIKGFAVTLMVGIATSLFTGVFCSKVMLDWIARGLKVQRLRVG
jgi:protein-export membrane protein SecD